MKQIVTLEKEIAFKTMVGEISSISLEPDLAFINDSEIEGNLIISGTYKMTEASTIEEEFSYKVPVEIMLTTALEEETRKVDINNFTYAIVNEEALSITVELLIEGLEKIEIEEEVEEEEEEVEEVIEPKEKVSDNVREIKDENIRESETIEDNTKEEIEVLTTDEEKEEEPVSLEEKLPSLEEVPVMKEEEKVTEPVMKEDTSNKQVMDSIFSAFANTEETYSTYSVYILREDDNLEEVIAKYNTNREVLSEYNDLDNLKVGSKLIIPTSVDSND